MKNLSTLRLNQRKRALSLYKLRSLSEICLHSRRLGIENRPKNINKHNIISIKRIPKNSESAFQRFLKDKLLKIKSNVTAFPRYFRGWLRNTFCFIAVRPPLRRDVVKSVKIEDI